MTHNNHNVPSDWEPVHGTGKQYTDFEGDDPVFIPGPLLGWKTPDGFVSPDKLPDQFRVKPDNRLLDADGSGRLMPEELSEQYPLIALDIYKAFGWQGGTIHQVEREIKRLREAETTLQAQLDRWRPVVEAARMLADAYGQRANGLSQFSFYGTCDALYEAVEAMGEGGA